MSKAVYYRLIALWVLNEALLGGIIHGLRIPVSGLVVGSAAVINICLIAYYVREKGAILKATIIVAIFKMMLSPQAPLPAYIAVFFQGLTGELMFWNRRYYKLSCVLFAVVALVESAVQRILVLTLIYGNDAWTAFDQFINGLTKQKVHTGYSRLIATVYVALHIIAGFIVGWWASQLPSQVEKWKTDGRYDLLPSMKNADELPVKKKRKKWWLVIVWVALLALYIQSYYGIGKPLLPATTLLKLLIRSAIILLTWYLVVGPLLQQALFSWLAKKRSRLSGEMAQVLQLLPASRHILTASWQQSKNSRGISRLITWMKKAMVNSLLPGAHARCVILTGAIGSGKTTALVNWVRTKKAAGILTPIEDGKRMFLNIATGEIFLMEAGEDEPDVLTVGRHRFSMRAFEKAIEVIRHDLEYPGWLIIDEVGPLELRGAGFSAIVKEVLERREGNTLLVVREGMVQEVQQYFKIECRGEVYGVSGLRSLNGNEIK